MITKDELELASKLSWQIQATTRLIEQIQEVFKVDAEPKINNFGFDMYFPNFKHETTGPNVANPTSFHLNPENIDPVAIKAFLGSVLIKAKLDLADWKKQLALIVK